MEATQSRQELTEGLLQFMEATAEWASTTERLATISSRSFGGGFFFFDRKTFDAGMAEAVNSINSTLRDLGGITIRHELASQNDNSKNVQLVSCQTFDTTQQRWIMYALRDSRPFPLSSEEISIRLADEF